MIKLCYKFQNPETVDNPPLKISTNRRIAFKTDFNAKLNPTKLIPIIRV